VLFTYFKEIFSKSCQRAVEKTKSFYFVLLTGLNYTLNEANYQLYRVTFLGDKGSFILVKQGAGDEDNAKESDNQILNDNRDVQVSSFVVVI
jgi:hypothetical protein